MIASPLRVECRWEGGEPVPQRFGHPDSMHEVGSVLDRWPGAGYCYYRVVTTEGVHYILRHDEIDHCWRIHFLDAHMRSVTRG